MKLKIIFSVFATALLLSSCMSRMTRQKELVCPKPPPPVCAPTQWEGMPYDSSYEVNQMMDFYYRFDKVQQINTIDNEWCLSFLDERHAALMYDDAGRQKVMMVRLIRFNKGRLESGFGIPRSGHVGTMSFNEKDVVFSITPLDGLIGRADMFQGKLKGNYINKITEIKSVNQDEYTWEAHPSLSSDGRVMFFSSDQFPGHGGTDIWFTIKKRNNLWSEPINCGEIINTGCHELSPFISKDGKKLLFSSSGHETVGGYDIFSVEVKKEFWDAVKNDEFADLEESDKLFGKVKNLKPPLNTIYDEMFPSSPTDVDSILYYSSNQDKDKASLISMEGGFDIFVRKKVVKKKDLVAQKKKPETEFVPEIEVDIAIEEPELNISPTYKLEGTVFQQVTMEEIPEAEITVKKLPEKSVYKEVKTDKRGHFEILLEKDVSYDVIAEAKGLFYDSKTVYVDAFDTVSNVKYEFEIPEVFMLRINFPSDVFDNPYRYVLDENGVETTEIWEEEINNLADNIKKSLPYVKTIELTGHTDDVGTAAYNKNLARKRVEFVIAELIKRGVPKEAMKGISAGESKPLKKREGEDLEMFRKRLRRVELQRILKN